MGSCTPSCGSGLSLCSGACSDTAHDPANCGGCGNACASRPNTVPVCTAGSCGSLCNPSYGDCNGSLVDGCESSLESVSNCGACGRACASLPNASSTCVAGLCGYACNAGFGNCNTTTVDGCETSLSTPSNCGSCGNVCPGAPNAAPTCSAGSCALVCGIGYADCNVDRTDGCETPITTTSNCGACGRVCAIGEICSSGACVTAAGYSQTFSGTATATQCAAWNSYRASLTGVYSKVTISGTYDPTGVSCTGSGANTLCQALRTGVATAVSCGTRTWRVGTCGTDPFGGSSIEISAMGDTCGCHTSAGYVARPCINSANWGGANTTTCGAPAQTLTVTCE